MAKTMRKYFRENFNGTEAADIYPSESFPTYGILYIYSMTITQHKRTVVALIFKMVFLRIPNVQLDIVFAETVPYFKQILKHWCNIWLLI